MNNLLNKLKIPITDDNGVLIVTHKDLDGGLIKNKLNRRTFSALFGIQTCSEKGVYAHDAEAVLQRMINGSLTGSQLFWD